MPKPTPEKMSAEFISRAVNMVAQWPDHQPMPEPIQFALAAEVDLASDVFTDSVIERGNIVMLGITPAERINIAFPDGSHVTALASYGEDHLDLIDERITDDAWHAHRNTRVVINPYGDAGMRVFDNLAAGHNADRGHYNKSDDHIKAGQPQELNAALQSFVDGCTTQQP